MAKYKESKMLLPKSDHRNYGKMHDWQYITIHNTANRASARAEAKYVHSGKSEVTYHFAIDDKECINILPLDIAGWHSGDSRGQGNTNSVAIEICYSLDKGDKRYPIAEDNAAHKAAKLLASKGFGIDRLRKHQDWSGKYCPHRMLDNKGWEPFKRKVQGYLDEMKGSKTPIMGPQSASLYQMQKWAEGKGADVDFIKLADKYIEYSKAYGVDPVVTYAQSGKETGFFKFGGVLDKTFKNPCGMKTRAGGGNYDKSAHQRFESWDNGIRAQAQHLALYAGSKSYPWKTNYDPRNFKSIHGTSPTVEDLGGKWAPSASYGKDIVKMMDQIKNTKVSADDIKRLQDKYADNLADASKVQKAEDKEVQKNGYVVAYVSDGDLANALALFNSLPNASMLRTDDATSYKDNYIIQVGGKEIKGSDLILAGKDRAETLEKISKWVKSL